jgi:hypothetical protein
MISAFEMKSGSARSRQKISRSEIGREARVLTQEQKMKRILLAVIGGWPFGRRAFECAGTGSVYFF